MNRYENLLKLKKKLKSCKTKDELKNFSEEANVIDPLLLAQCSTVSLINSDSMSDNDIKHLIKLFDLAIDNNISKIPNIEEYKMVLSYIEKANNALHYKNKNKIETLSIEIYKTFIGKISFPKNYEKWYLSDEIMMPQVGEYPNSIDLISIVNKLNIYKELLLERPKPTKDALNNKTLNQTFNISTNAESKVESRIEISIESKIENIIQQIENDDDLSEQEINDCKEQIEMLKKCANEKPKTKWGTCKKVLAWLGDKSVKFGKWIIPIIADILIAKNTTPTA